MSIINIILLVILGVLILSSVIIAVLVVKNKIKILQKQFWQFVCA